MSTSLRDALQAALRDRYAVEHEIGRGGMATVFLGHDPRLQRRVAIKVFEQLGTDSTGAERFLREVRVAAQLQHPNILTVFDSGEASGLLYYVMPYVAGPTLRERLEREGPLPMGDAIRIGCEVAEALDHAHRAGVVHRDIKPDNILLADGVAVVADFGIARALESGKLTETGLVLGTPSYMSPEQATATAHLDGRSDLYALGCVLYEMLTGSPPFTGPTGQVVMARHAMDTAAPMATVRPVPRPLEDVVAKALAKLPADRWATGKEFASVLALSAPSTTMPTPSPEGRQRARLSWRTLLAAAVVAMSVTVAWTVWNGARVEVFAANDSVRSVAVVPIAALGDTGLTKFADGFTEAVIGGLVRMEELLVPSSNRVFAYRGREADPRTVGRELNAEMVVTGTLQEAAGRLRLVVQLVDVSNGMIRATGLFEGLVGDVWAMQDSITARLADVLRPRLSAARRAEMVRGERTRDTLALRLYLESRPLSIRPNRENIDRAEALLHRALARDSAFADAWAGLGEVYIWRLVWNFEPPAGGIVRARQFLDQAIALDSLNSLAFHLRAFLRYNYERDFIGGGRDVQHSTRLAPGLAQALIGHANFLGYIEARSDSALIYAKRALEIDSTVAWYWGTVSEMFALNAQHDSAIAYAERGYQVDSTWFWFDWVLMNGYYDQGRRAAADSSAARMLRMSGDVSWALAMIARYYERSGNAAGAHIVLQRLNALKSTRYVSSAHLGAAYLATGDRESALRLLEQAVRDHDFGVLNAMNYTYRSLVGDSRFEALVRQVARPPAVFSRDFPW